MPPMNVSMKIKTTVIRLLLAVTVIGVSFRTARANEGYGVDGDTTVWFVNMYPGSDIYELEGHSALRIRMPGNDLAINYGMFSFDAPNFVYRFVKGETDYMAGAIPWGYFEREYIDAGRRMVAHKLNLTSEQKQRLLTIVANNLLPENRVYRYNYVLDNCATRPLRTVELATGDSILLSQPDDIPDLQTFRDYMRYYHRNYPWYQFGIDLALGTGIDRQITVREKSFAPVILDMQLDEARLTDGTPLTIETVVLNDTDPDGRVLAPTHWYLRPITVSWVLSLFVIIYALVKCLRYGRYPRGLVTVLFTCFTLAGLVVTFLVFVSVHEATSPNYNLLWLNPLCVIPAICLWIKKAKIAVITYFFLNFVLLISLLSVWLLGIQSPNPAFIPLVMADMTLSALYIYLNINNLVKKQAK